MPISMSSVTKWLPGGPTLAVVLVLAGAGCFGNDNLLVSLSTDASVDVSPDASVEEIRDTSAADTPPHPSDASDIPTSIGPTVDAPGQIPDHSIAPPNTAALDGGAERPATVEAGPLDAAFVPTSCFHPDMVWRDDTGSLLRRDPSCASATAIDAAYCYSFPEDHCAGFRCLVDNELSPACYTHEQCTAACRGTCVSIPSMRALCQVTDGGAGSDGAP